MPSSKPDYQPALPADLEAIFTANKDSPLTLLESFMPVFCDHVKADRIFLQPRNPDTRVCKVLRWRRSEEIPWPAIPNESKVIDGWFVEDKWEVEDPLWRAALQLKPSIYITSLSLAASEGLLNLEFENKYMFHTAFIHGHAQWPPISDEGVEERKFYGSAQPAVFDGDREWTVEIRELVEKCLIRIAPVMKVIGESAPGLGEFGIGV